MVIILSDENEFSTDRVIDWLIYYNMKFVRLNVNNPLFLSNITINEKGNFFFIITFEVNGRNFTIKSSEITSFWYRRSDFSTFVNSLIINGNNEFPNDIISEYLTREDKSIKHFLHILFNKYPNINSKLNARTSKLENLLIAGSVGLKIPISLITQSKKVVSNFLNDNNTIITKSMEFGFMGFKKEYSISLLTKLVEKEDLLNCPDWFFPTFFQSYIEKKYELRIFYLDKNFYSTAIFSQRDSETKVDFRNYNFSKMNRTPKFELPNIQKRKLIKLMDLLGLNCGSIDMIVTDNCDFIFLEVNPIGQFEQVSSVANYYLEQKIANYLCQN